MPAQPDASWKRSMARLRQLEKIANKVKTLEKQMIALATEKGIEDNG